MLHAARSWADQVSAVGPKGNVEFLVWMDQVRTKFDRKGLVEGGDEGLSQLVENVLTS